MTYFFHKIFSMTAVMKSVIEKNGAKKNLRWLMSFSETFLRMIQVFWRTTILEKNIFWDQNIPTFTRINIFLSQIINELWFFWKILKFHHEHVQSHFKKYHQTQWIFAYVYFKLIDAKKHKVHKFLNIFLSFHESFLWTTIFYKPF